jgi:hypothetical protein
MALPFNDQVVRKGHFLDEHPEWTITRLSGGSGYRAERQKPITVVATNLGLTDLLNKLVERIEREADEARAARWAQWRGQLKAARRVAEQVVSQ